MKIPGFDVECFIAEGGMASVFLAVQRSLNRRVALKILKKFDNPAHNERFLNEGRIIASLNHRNIITIHDIGCIGDQHYISMEYLDGGSLKERIRSGMQESEILDLMESIGSCLHFVHSREIIHRDIKPSNILFHKDGSPKLTDFGVSKQLNNDQDLTIDGSAFGSPYYISPEQAEGRTLDGRTDIYALGIIFYEMLTGKKPFAEKSPIETILAHLTHPIPELPKAYSKYQDLLERMVAKDLRDRFTSAKELLDLLHLLRHSEAPAQSRKSGIHKKHAPVEKSGNLGTQLSEQWHVAYGKLRGVLGFKWPGRFYAATKKQWHMALMKLRGIPGFKWLGRSGAVLGKRWRMASMTQKGILVTALLLLVIGTGIPLRGQLSSQDSELAVIPKAVSNGVSVEPTQEVLEPVSVQREASGEPPPAILTEVPSRKSYPAEPVVVEPDEQPHAVQPEQPGEQAVPITPAHEAPDEQPRIAKSSSQPEDQTEQVIARLLKDGDRALKAYRLTTPSEDNAYSYYQNVIELDPDNIRANEGIEKIANIYARLVRKELDKQNLRSARVYLRRGINVQPDHVKLSMLGAEINRMDQARMEQANEPQAVEEKKEKDKFSERFKNFWKKIAK